jgi:hypothetical protein
MKDPEWASWLGRSPLGLTPVYACPICGCALLRPTWEGPDPREVHWNWHVRRGHIVPGKQLTVEELTLRVSEPEEP